MRTITVHRIAAALALVAVVGACDLAIPAPSTGAAEDPGPSPTASASVRPSFVRPTPTPQPTFLAYVVRRGDTLTSIARAHATSPRSIAFWNREAYPSLDPDAPEYEPDRIEAGWVLRLIPGVEVDPDDLL